MSLEITYYTEGLNRGIYGMPITSVTVTAGNVSPASPSNAEVVRIKSLANNRFAYGADPEASASAGPSGHFIAQGDVLDLPAVRGWKIAVA